MIGISKLEIGNNQFGIQEIKEMFVSKDSLGLGESWLNVILKNG